MSRTIGKGFLEEKKAGPYTHWIARELYENNFYTFEISWLMLQMVVGILASWKEVRKAKKGYNVHTHYS